MLSGISPVTARGMLIHGSIGPLDHLVWLAGCQGQACLGPLGMQELLLGRHQFFLFHPFGSLGVCGETGPPCGGGKWDPPKCLCFLVPQGREDG